MKKQILCILFILLCSFLYSETIMNSLKEKNKNLNLIIQDNDKNYIMSAFFSSEIDNPQFGFEGSGYETIISRFRETDNELNFFVIFLWTGDEYEENQDARTLSVYKIKLEKNRFLESINKSSKKTIIQYVELNYNPLVFYASDSNGSVNLGNDFYANTITILREKKSFDSRKICDISSEKFFSIIDIVKNISGDDVWVKIKIDNNEGYIPLENLGKKWEIKVNNLTD